MSDPTDQVGAGFEVWVSRRGRHHYLRPGDATGVGCGSWNRDMHLVPADQTPDPESEEHRWCAKCLAAVSVLGSTLLR